MTILKRMESGDSLDKDCAVGCAFIVSLYNFQHCSRNQSLLASHFHSLFSQWPPVTEHWDLCEVLVWSESHGPLIISLQIFTFHLRSWNMWEFQMLPSRAVTIHQTHDSVRIMIFDPRFGSYHDFFVGGGRKKKRFLKQYFLLNNIWKIFKNWTPKNKINYANY